MDAPPDSAIGGTYVGNPVAQAAALAVLDVFNEEHLVERGAAIGDTIRSRMQAWQERWRPSATCAASARCWRSSSCSTPRRRSRPPTAQPPSSRRPLQNGLLLIKSGTDGNCIRVLTPLVVTDAELEEALGVWEQALEKVLVA